jgi:hypothetical protein
MISLNRKSAGGGMAGEGKDEKFKLTALSHGAG